MSEPFSKAFRALAIAAALLVPTAVLVPLAPEPAHASGASSDRAVVKSLSGSSFNPGNIISDSQFYDGRAMSQAEIQTFLSAKVGKCTNGKCLSVIKVAADSQPAYVSDTTGNTACVAIGGGSMTAAAWIYKVQVACGISARVILVTLQKEQGLVTNTAPGDYALTYAMGMGCPDTTGCTSAPKGLATQIYRGARQLKIYKASKFGRQPGVQTILYSPNAERCGGASVRIQNYATAALYNYTPYQPNAAALANLGGTGDSCSSYGNRNFWYYYTTWFGSTQSVASGWIDSGAGVFAVGADGSLALYAGNGKSGWKATTTLAATFPAVTHLLGAGDFDGDGHRDLLTIDPGGALWLTPSDGLAGLGTPVKIADGWGDVTAFLAPGDMTGDGVPDVVSRDPAGTLWLHPGNGRGELREPVLIGGGYVDYNVLFAPGDFNGDGKVDLMGRDDDGRLWLFRGTGVGGLRPRLQVGKGWGGFDALLGPGDFNGDRKVDVLGRTAAGDVRLYPGNGTGGWGRPVVVATGWDTLTMVSGSGAMPTAARIPQGGVGDLNGDTTRDVLGRTTTGQLYLYPGNGKGGWASRILVSSSWGTTTATVGVGDMNSDGITDVLVRDAAGVLWRYPSDGRGGFGTPVQVATGWGGYDAIVGAGDLTLDRIPDVLARDEAGKLWLFAGDGAGGLKPATQVGNGWSTLRIFSTGDFDGDGVGDVLAILPNGTLRLYAGDGSGGWLPPVQIGRGWAGMNAVFGPGDFNGDKRTDVIARDGAGGLWLYPGNGVGGFLSRVKIGRGWLGFDTLS